MKIEITMQEIPQTSTNTESNKYKIAFEAVGDKCDCQKLINQMSLIKFLGMKKYVK